MPEPIQTRFAAETPAGRTGALTRPPSRPDAADELVRHFRQNYPVLLDGALPKAEDRRQFIQNARASLRRGKVDPDQLPAGVLRQTLANLAAALPENGNRQCETKAGLTAVGPKTAQVWWDETVLDNLDDVIAQLDKPRAVLRFYDITGLAADSGRWNSTFDIDIKMENQGKCQSFWADDRVYVVELGYVYADGRFLRLARTNVAALPRGGKGAAGKGETVKVQLPHRGVKVDLYREPDAAAEAWAEKRPGLDHENRDLRAEMLVHMLYRSFLREGPRALRRAPEIARRDAETLKREFSRRENERRKRRLPDTGAEQPAAPALLIAWLDAAPGVTAPRPGMRYQPAAVTAPVWARAAASPLTRAEFAWYAGLLTAARQGARPVTEAEVEPETVTEVWAENEPPVSPSLVRMVPDSLNQGSALPMSLLASPVFAAARSLQNSLAELSSLESPISDRGLDELDGEDDLPAGDCHYRKDGLDESLFGGSEAKRLAKAGVRITRMALTLEGRMRPGARLKVAGKLVYADASGRFRLECVLSGKRASIPMRAGTSIEGEARSLINVEWEKREGKKAGKG